jgi:hypothetical protein
MTESELLKYILEAFQYDPVIKMFRRNVGGMEKENGSKKQSIKFGQRDKAIYTVGLPNIGVHFVTDCNSVRILRLN